MREGGTVKKDGDRMARYWITRTALEYARFVLWAVLQIVKDHVRR